MKFCKTIRERVYPDAKADLATLLHLKALHWSSCSVKGIAALVTPQNWFFLGSYKSLRRRLLETKEWLVG